MPVLLIDPRTAIRSCNEAASLAHRAPSDLLGRRLDQFSPTLAGLLGSLNTAAGRVVAPGRIGGGAYVARGVCASPSPCRDSLPLD